MAKVLPATFAAGVVKVGSLSIADAVVYSEGDSSSEGIVILQNGEAYYIAKVTPDLKTTIEKTASALEDIVSALTEVTTALSSIAAVTGPAWVPPPTIATAVAQITTKAIAITATQTELETLKEALK